MIHGRNAAFRLLGLVSLQPGYARLTRHHRYILILIVAQRSIVPIDLDTTIGHRWDNMRAARLQSDILAWYDAHARTLPWRAKPGHAIDPYSVWLSEVMLQQTTVATVGPYFRAFRAKWPTVQDLAAAAQADVLAAWAGLGYYSRARNLHACAQVVARDFGGQFPASEAELRTLPGVGPYTAAAIAAIAFGRPAVVVDGNIDRIMTRLHAAQRPIRDNKAAIYAWAAALTPQTRPGDYAQALMDLGATLCRPAQPACLTCPIQAHCAAHRQGLAADLPRKAPRRAKPTRHGLAYLITNRAGHILIAKRPPQGLLGGMDALPTSDWTATCPPPRPDARPLQILIQHTFTHFHLRLHLYAAPEGAAADFPEARFVPDLEGLALPTLFKKALNKIVEKTDEGANLSL